MAAFRFSVLLPFVAFSVAATPAPQQAPPEPNPSEIRSATTAPTGAMIVYVSDFDLDVVQRKPAPKAAPRASRTSKPASASRSPSGVPRMGSSASPPESPASQSAASEEETPANQAHALVSAVSENIIRALTQAGFDARRLPGGAPLPQQGVRITGVFAEADEQNRARRLLVGGEPAGPNIILYVGVNNLKSPPQPLYELADRSANDPRHGPVITVTSYTPAERFELSRDPSGDELQKISKQIAADLSALVSANRLSPAQ